MDEGPQASSTPKSDLPATASKHASFSIWPPSEKTRGAVRERLVETLSTPSMLSKRYGEISREEAVEIARRIEEEAFGAMDSSEKSLDGGIDTLHSYSKEISKRMLENVKSRSAGPPAAAPQDTASLAADFANSVDLTAEDDAGSSAPPHSEKTESTAGDD